MILETGVDLPPELPAVISARVEAFPFLKLQQIAHSQHREWPL
jgi:hypothetical protein